MKRAWSARRLLLLTATLLASACSRGEAALAASPKPAPATGSSAGAAAGKVRLVFFMNPNGAPCQMQDGILRDMASELKDRVEVVRYRTTDEGDLAQFEQYGIRSLPTLVVTDASGHELRRASPGIQSAASVRGLLSP